MSNPTTITVDDGVPFVDTVREFDAPVSAVFKAHVDPDLLAKWLGPRSTTMNVTEYNTVTGGSWRYESGDGNNPCSGRGVFHKVDPDALIIMTFEFDGAPDQVGISTTTFEEVDGRTRIVAHEVYPSVEARDMALATGMNYGVIEGYERLDELLSA
ncbi:SRPBCC family protein [Paenarthrobacter sp. AR 02]|uniref:SRPBCC family protein n=1 Tax=Paenarthrobacter sp. AR 02 TaxID=2899821 RepID=UPI001F2213D2|nr:SRPBCC family protein [Paenarthrobacter sp. AR 02]MCF3140535.1 SRPBCC family protein [Paenarthrobacter sp. AR 02]